MTTAVLALGVLSFGSVSCLKKPSAQMQPPAPPTVQVTTPQIKDVPIFKEWVGSLTGKVNAKIMPQVTGYLDQQIYKNGQVVKKGDVLFRIDARTFKAALDQAAGDLAKSKAALTKNQLDVERYTPLVKTNAVSQKQLDDAIQATKESQAAVEASQAAVDTAKLNLGFTVVSSPIDGIAGIATAQIGDLVSPGGMVLTQVSAVDPIRIDFAITEQDWLGTAVNNKTLQTAEDGNLEVILSNNEVYSHKATAVAVNREVNSNTGTINIEAEVDNPDKLLRPGMFVRVRAQVNVVKGAMVVPSLAVVAQQGAYFVITVNEKGEPGIVPVKPGVVSNHEQVVIPIFEGSLTDQSKVIVVGTLQAMMRAPKNPGEAATGTVNTTPYVPQLTQPLIQSAAPKADKPQQAPEKK